MSTDTTPAVDAGRTEHLSRYDWLRVRRSVPIFCVDLVPTRRVHGRPEVGLILSDTPDAGRQWCLPGGPVRLAETLDGARERVWSETFELPVVSGRRHPGSPFLMEYAVTPSDCGPYDVRQHRISAVFVLEADGEVAVQGDAYDFQWFTPELLRGRRPGFGQAHVIERALAPLGWVA